MRHVILDRDGVINFDSPHYVKSTDEWIPIPGSLEAVARLNHYGFKVAIASNQSGLARGLFTSKDLNAIHQKLRTELDKLGGQIEGLFFCPHGPDDGCECRKPKPGLLYEIRDRLKFPLGQSIVVGDSLRDIQSGMSVGATTILVETGNGQRTLRKHAAELDDTLIAKDLSAAVDLILEKFRE